MANFSNIKIKHNNSKVRESGIELLRILAIFFVIVIHEIPVFVDHSSLFLVIGRIISWPAIFAFAFITGYYLILKSDDENKLKRFLFLTLEIVIWRVLVSLIYLSVSTIGGYYTGEQFVGMLFGTIILDLFAVKFWYFWAIIFIYLIFPFFSNYLNKNYQGGKKLLGWLLIFLLIITTLATLGSGLSGALGYNFSLYTDNYTLVVVLVAAVFGGYWHLVEQEKKISSSWKLQVFGLIGLLSVYMINFTFYWWLNSEETGLTYLSPLWSLAGWFYFLIFQNFKFHSRIINWWAGLSWWIYVLHNGDFLPRGWGRMIASVINVDPYSQTILAILFCYVLTIFLTVLIQNLDRFIFKPYLVEKIKVFWNRHVKLKKKSSKKIRQ